MTVHTYTFAVSLPLSVTSDKPLDLSTVEGLTALRDLTALSIKRNGMNDTLARASFGEIEHAEK